MMTAEERAVLVKELHDGPAYLTPSELDAETLPNFERDWVLMRRNDVIRCIERDDAAADRIEADGRELAELRGSGLAPLPRRRRLDL